MPNRYVPRTRPPTAMDVLTKQGAAYPEPTVGEEGSISPEVLLESIQGNIDARTSQIQSRREGAGGLIKAGYVANKEGWLKPLGDKMWHTAGHAKMAISNKAGNANAYVAGAKNFATGIKIGAKNVAGGTPFAGAGTASTAASTATSMGAAVPPLLAAVAISKLVGSTKMGKQWNRSTNKWLKKKTGTGRTKNLLSPWKWRL